MHGQLPLLERFIRQPRTKQRRACLSMLTHDRGRVQRQVHERHAALAAKLPRANQVVQSVHVTAQNRQRL